MLYTCYHGLSRHKGYAILLLCADGRGKSCSESAARFGVCEEGCGSLGETVHLHAVFLSMSSSHLYLVPSSVDAGSNVRVTFTATE